MTIGSRAQNSRIERVRTGQARVALIWHQTRSEPFGLLQDSTTQFFGDTMQSNDSPCYIFRTHTEAEEAIRMLIKSGFDAKKLSLIGKGYHSEEKPVGFYTAGDRIKSWGGVGAFWGGIWGLLLAPAVFVLPGLGVLAMAGPVVTVLVSALEGAVLVGGVSALGAALSQIGVPKDKVVKYEEALKMNSYVLVVHGGNEDQARVRSILDEAKTYAAA
jgi:hypothetical protein